MFQFRSKQHFALCSINFAIHVLIFCVCVVIFCIFRFLHNVRMMAELYFQGEVGNLACNLAALCNHKRIYFHALGQVAKNAKFTLNFSAIRYQWHLDDTFELTLCDYVAYVDSLLRRVRSTSQLRIDDGNCCKLTMQLCWASLSYLLSQAMLRLTLRNLQLQSTVAVVFMDSAILNSLLLQGQVPSYMGVLHLSKC